MSDIKAELTGLLDKAMDRYEDARKEVELLDALIAEFQRLTAQDTRAFPAVPPRSAPVQTVPDRSAVPGVNAPPFTPSIDRENCLFLTITGNQWDLKVAYLDFRDDRWEWTGEVELGEDSKEVPVMLRVGGTQTAPFDYVIEHYGPLRPVTSIVPAPPAAATITDPPADETPKDGADHG